jgi:hypothetical protein
LVIAAAPRATPSQAGTCGRKRQLDELGAKALPLAYDIRVFDRLGLLHELIAGVSAEAPPRDSGRVTAGLAAAERPPRLRPLVRQR